MGAAARAAPVLSGRREECCPPRIPGKDGARQAPDPLENPLMALLRRALVALGVAGIIAAVLRLRGSGGTPPQQGGWRELELE